MMDGWKFSDDGKSNGDQKPEVTLDDDMDEEAKMQALLGFGSFDTTKVRH